MSLDGLTDSTLARVELHRSLDLEPGGVGSVAADSDEHEPFLIWCNTVVDDLIAGEGSMAVEHLDGRIGGLRRRSGGGGVGDPATGRTARQQEFQPHSLALSCYKNCRPSATYW